MDDAIKRLTILKESIEDKKESQSQKIIYILQSPKFNLFMCGLTQTQHPINQTKLVGKERKSA